MSCTKRFLNFQWADHAWRARVSSAETVPTHETNMWGRVVHGECVRCHKQDVCEACGETRGDMSCLCETEHAERCPIRLGWIDASRHAVQ